MTEETRGSEEGGGGLYAAAGVNILLGNEVKSGLQELVGRTYGPQVLGKIGGFGGFFRADFGGMEEPVLVASADGVGTKLKVAVMAGKHDTVGEDLVNHCINDLAVTGARPLFFLDYVAFGELDAEVFRQVMEGLVRGCELGGCALLGGETAQMPGMYQRGEYDLAGFIVGVVERRKVMDGQQVRAGDVLVGLPSNGLHTNGYSLARKILFEKMGYGIGDRPEGWERTIGEELLRVHLNYEPQLRRVAGRGLHAAAHITGGGFEDNIVRILPEGLRAIVDARVWKVPKVFQFLCEKGGVEVAEMYRVFNMGIGMVLVVGEREVEEVEGMVGGVRVGRVVEG
ncbi:MAG: phosphoribosylformylglycinamidine cyclo-ligase, partial [Chthoniobacterales bacterium]|nr:phosphoribosylformylglycinamidine cyclo-ligase [Chthoniobacterales bacterium]